MSRHLLAFMAPAATCLVSCAARAPDYSPFAPPPSLSVVPPSYYHYPHEIVHTKPREEERHAQEPVFIPPPDVMTDLTDAATAPTAPLPEPKPLVAPTVFPPPHLLIGSDAGQVRARLGQPAKVAKPSRDWEMWEYHDGNCSLRMSLRLDPQTWRMTVMDAEAPPCGTS